MATFVMFVDATEPVPSVTLQVWLGVPGCALTVA
jgi:hypothetical protein